MDKRIYLLVMAIIFGSYNEVEASKSYTDIDIVNAIYHAENSVKYPYGIKSINTKGNKELARKICLNTVKNNRKRFRKQTYYKDYIEFLGSRYCPTKGNISKSERKLNKNWVKNVKYHLNKHEQKRVK